jgi:DNA-binding CsgD family transcriptional regulator
VKYVEFVGRDGELCQLHERLQEAVSGHGSVVLVRGEVGVGKTRLLRHFARRAAADGVTLTEGRWYESQQAPAYVGFCECLLQLLANDAVRHEISLESPYVRDLARLGPEFAGVLGMEPERTDEAGEPYRLWQGVAILLKAASRAAPTIMLLDDLQWADQGSLELLGFLGRDVADLPLLILAGYREDDVDEGHPVLKAVVSLREGRSLSVINLRGLNGEEVQRMAEGVSGATIDGAIIEPLCELTKGNPLFIEEMVRDLLARQRVSSIQAPESLGQLLGKPVPEAIRDVMARRLQLLSPECQYFLQLAACVGRHFDCSMIGQVGDLGQPAVLALVDEALAASIVEESAPGVFFFSHPLMREVVYAAMSAPSKMAKHQRVATALESHYGPLASTHAREIAKHLVSAGGLTDPRRTLLYCVEGARLAGALNAFEEAARLARAGLSSLERTGMHLPRLRAAILLQLGYAEAALGSPEEGLSSFREALAIYQALADDEGATDAYRWITTVMLRHGRWAEGFVAAREGLATAVERPTHAFVGLAGAYALALLVIGQTEEAAVWARKLAPLGFDDETCAVVQHALAGQHSWGIEDSKQATTKFEVARHLFLTDGRDGTSAQVALDHAVAAYFLGEFETARGALVESERLASATNRLSILADIEAFKSLASVHEGAWDRAHEAWRRWDALRKSLGGSTIYGQLAERAVALERYWRKGPAGVADLLNASFPMTTDPLQLFLHVEQGDDEAQGRRDMGELKAGAMPGRGLFWLSGRLPLLAACSTLGDEGCDTLADGLEAYAGGLLDWFMVDIELGRAAAASNRWDEADRHFRRATVVCRDAGLRAFEAQVYLHHGLMYLSRRLNGDRRAGLSLLEQARSKFEELDLAYQVATVDAVLARSSRGRPLKLGPAVLTGREQAVLSLVAKGFSNRKIAEELFVSERTVERHLENSYHKIGVTNRAAAIGWLASEGHSE